MSANESDQSSGLRFDRMEFAGALGDLGTLLPIVIAMILINKLSVTSVFLGFGAFYVLTGIYYRIPIPVQPLKAVGAIAIANAATITEPVIAAAGIIFGALLIVLSITGLIDKLAKLFTAPVVRGIQLGLGLIFLKKGIELIATPKLFMGRELAAASAIPHNTIIGIAVFIIVLLLLDNKKLPAAIAALAVGIGAGIAYGGAVDLKLALGPSRVEFIFPSAAAFSIAFFQLILPQMPLTIGNACVGTADTACTLFPKHPAIGKSTAGRFALSMGLANLPIGFIGGVPMCHGTGGLAAHYRFGARTGGAPVIIGIIFLVLALGLGQTGVSLLTLIPNGVLGVLLIFAGLELAPLIKDLKTNEERFVSILIAGIALAVSNMAWAFAAGIVTDLIIRKFRIKI